MIAPLEWWCLTCPTALAGGYKPAKREDTNARRKARKERARMLTRKREDELRAQRLSS